MINFDVGKLVSSLGLDNSEFMRSMQEAERRMQTASTQMSTRIESIGTTMQATGKKMQSTGKVMSMAITAPLALMGGAMLNTAMGFEKSMNQVAAVSQATGDELKQLEAVAREMGATTKFSAIEAAGGLNFLAMAGFSVQESITALPATLKLASAGAMELAESADIVSNVMQGFGLDASQTAETVDILTKAFTSSNTNLSQLGEAMSYAAPMAKAFGQDIITATAAVGFLSDAGIQGTRAGTGLSQSLLQLSKNADKLGLDIKDAEGNLIPLVNILEEVEKAGISTGVMIETLGARAGPAFATLMGRGSKALEEFSEELRNSQGIAEEVSNIQMQGLAGALTVLRSAFAELSIAMMQDVVPVLEGLAVRVKGVVDWLATLDDRTRKIIVITAALAAAMGPVLIITGQLFIAMGAITKAMAGSAIAIRALTAAKILLTRAQLALNAAYLANPMGVTIMAVAALAAGLYALTRNTERQTAAQKALEEANNSANTQYAEQAAVVERLRWTVENNNISLENRRKALAELQAIVPAYNASLTDEGVLINNNTEALKGYLEQLRAKIRFQAFEDKITQELKKQEEARLHLSDTEVRAAELREIMNSRDVQLTFRQTREMDRLTRARNKSAQTIRETTEAIEALTTSQEQYNRRLQETQLNELLSDLDTMASKLESFTKDQLLDFRNLMQERITEATRAASEALTDLEKTAAETKLQGLRTGVELIDVRLKTLNTTIKQTQDGLKGITVPDLSFQVMDVGTGIFDDLIAELEDVDAIFAKLDDTIKFVDIKGDFVDDFDVISAKIRATETALNDMIALVVEGKGDPAYIEYLAEQLGILQQQANEAKQALQFEQAVENMSEQFMRMREIGALLGESHMQIVDEFGEHLGQLRDALNDGLSLTDDHVIQLIERLRELGLEFETLSDGAQRWRDFGVNAASAFGDAMGELVSDSGRTTKEIIGNMLRQVTAMLIRDIVASIPFPANLVVAAGAPLLAGAMFQAIGMKEGGQVPGGYPNDTYPALLTSGETVVPPEDLDRLLAKMSGIIAGVAGNAMSQVAKVAQGTKNVSNVQSINETFSNNVTQHTTENVQNKAVSRTENADNSFISITESFTEALNLVTTNISKTIIPSFESLSETVKTLETSVEVIAPQSSTYLRNVNSMTANTIQNPASPDMTQQSMSENKNINILVAGKIAGEDIFISSERFEQRKRLIE